MIEYVKFNCHVMERNDVGKNTPETLILQYESKRKNGVDYVFDNIECVVSSVKWAYGRSSIITKIVRKEDIDNESVCTKQES
jgi:hypothetical protein